MKSPLSVTDPGAPVRLPLCAPNEVDYEAEIAFVVNKDCKDVPVDQADDFILGYTLAQDITARKWQGKKGGGQYTICKSFDTFCPIGPYIIRHLPENAVLRTVINGEERQRSAVNDMIFTPQQLLSFLTKEKTIPSGSVVLTGTPSGVGFVRKPPLWLKSGDEIITELLGPGLKMTNPVV